MVIWTRVLDAKSDLHKVAVSFYRWEKKEQKNPGKEGLNEDKQDDFERCGRKNCWDERSRRQNNDVLLRHSSQGGESSRVAFANRLLYLLNRFVITPNSVPCMRTVEEVTVTMY